VARSAIAPRLAWLAALSAVAFAGLASAYVTAGPAAGTAAGAKITICHATSSKTNPFGEQSPNADGVLSAHAHHPGDIIPPFELVGHGTTTIYPGKNMDTHYGSGYTGAELLANGCREPTGPASVTTIPEAIIEPPSKIIVPGKTTTEKIVETIVVPTITETAPGTTTVVTVPAGSETSVTLPERTVTLPPTTETTNGETIVLPSETVTLPEMIETVTGGASATVVTVTGPDKVVEDGTTATTRATSTVPAPREVTTEPAHTVDLHKRTPRGETVVETVPKTVTLPVTSITVRGTKTTETIIETITEPAARETPPGTATVVTVEGGASVKKRGVVTVTTPRRVVHEPVRVVHAEEKKVIVVVVHKRGCPPGTAFYNGACHHIALGKG
jgi:hypothetical protein